MEKNHLRPALRIIAAAMLFLAAASAGAFDFGILLDQNLTLNDFGSDTKTNYSASLIPRLAALLGDSGDFYFSASLNANYENEEWFLLPELLRAEIAWRSGSARIRAGRISYTDPLGLIVDGFFDGAHFSYDTGMGAFSAGAFYTGLLYKKRINIKMTGSDQASYSVPFDFADFADTYFASRRAVAALGWEHPALIGPVRARFAAISQLDLNDTDTKLNSHYLAGKISIPVQSYVFDLGGSFQLVESQDSSIKMGFATEVKASWMLPTAFPGRLSLAGCFTSGGTDGNITAFKPIAAKSRGNILSAGISGLSFLSLDYLARFHNTFSAGLNAMYFMRSDLGTYQGYPGSGGDGHLLGGEFFTMLVWSPVSDFQVKAGAGIFLPSLGNVEPKADTAWSIEIGVVFALY